MTRGLVLHSTPVIGTSLVCYPVRVRVGLTETKADFGQVHNSSVSRLYKVISFFITHVGSYCRTWLEGRNHGDSVRVKLGPKDSKSLTRFVVHKRGKNLPFVGAV